MYKQWKENEINYLKNNYGIISLSELAEYFDTTIDSVKRCAERNGIKSARAWSDEEIIFLKNNYQDMTYKELSTYLKRSKSAIDLKINRLGLIKSKYTYNKDFFENIDDGEKAYWLGFIMADGCVSVNHDINSCELSIKLQARDASHLKKFNKSINGNISIDIFEDLCNLNNKIYKQCQIRLYSEKMVHDLIKYGVIPNKSLVKQFPSNISYKFMWDYIRGYYDGNGGIVGSKETNKYAACYIYTGSRDFADGLKNFLNNNGIKTSSVFKPKEKDNCWKIAINGMKNVDDFLHRIYDNANIYLDRKKDKKDNIYNYLKLEQRLDRQSEKTGFVNLSEKENGNPEMGIRMEGCV